MKMSLNILMVLLLALEVSAVDASPPNEAARKVDSLFIIASSGEIKYRDMVQPAQDSLVAMGEAAVPRMVEKIDIKIAREARTVREVLIKIGAVAVPSLLTRLSDEDTEVVSKTCYILGKIGDSSAIDGLVDVSGHSDWHIRSSAVAALGDIGNERGYEVVSRALADTVGLVRKSAAVAGGKLMNEAAVPHLVGMLADDFYGARMCASEALVKFGKKSLSAIGDSLVFENELQGNLGCTTLGLIGGDSAAVILAAQLTSPSPMRRALAVEGILNCNSSLACGAVELLSSSEKDPLVLFYIEKVLEKYASK